MVPGGAQNGKPQPVVVDGAKHDRAIWSGDLVVEGPGIWDTLGALKTESSLLDESRVLARS